ncbi:MAG: hypothetical protein O3B76_07240 [Proteobacteria bacterium]|nr:hypothetical protein [Pseudomonadota bacterium]MDA1023231.1 hypothetical protein [Pseudomonadota bacterium]
MSIRNILTAGSLSALVGIAGVVSTGQAFADDSTLDLGEVAQTVQTVDAKFDYSFEGDSYIDHGEYVEILNQVEEATILDDDFGSFEIN